MPIFSNNKIKKARKSEYFNEYLLLKGNLGVFKEPPCIHTHIFV